jgi:hypothetical protein
MPATVDQLKEKYLELHDHQDWSDNEVLAYFIENYPQPLIIAWLRTTTTPTTTSTTPEK